MFYVIQKIQNMRAGRIRSVFLSLYVMVYRSISADMKRRALQQLEDGWQPQEIADVLGVSPKSIDRWHDNHETLGHHVGPLSFLWGRRRILSADVVEDLRDLI